MEDQSANVLSQEVLIALAAAGGAALVMLLAEVLHLRRKRRLAALAFGPGQRAAHWTTFVPLLRVASVFGVVWGLTVLFQIPPKVHHAHELKPGEYRHVILVLDVSPSMRLQDAGQERKEPRMQRAAEVMESFFRRVPIEQYRMSVVAFYTSAKPVVEETSDLEVVRNILSDLPMYHAFKTGETDVFAGLEQAAEIARPFQPRSTTVILLSDGDTVPAVGMPKMPASVAHVVVVGVGDSRQGSFIDGRQSRQDVSTLRQIAARMGGNYHNGNEKHLPSSLLEEITQTSEAGAFVALTLREYALAAATCGAGLLALLPLLLHCFGTRWRPGVPHTVAQADTASSTENANKQHKQRWVETGPRTSAEKNVEKVVSSIQ